MFKMPVLIWVFLAGLSGELRADTLYLKNERSIEGIIKIEDGESIELEVCSGGSVRLKKSEIERIEKSTPEESGALRQKWERQKKESEDRLLRQRLEEEREPKKVEFSNAIQGIVVEATLNRKVQASLILDTGASIIMLRKNIAEKLGIKLDQVKPDMKVTVADGRQINAKHIILESVKVEKVEADNVDAAVLLDEVGDVSFGDGLLGMSFLKRFNFKIDHKDKKLILEKL